MKFSFKMIFKSIIKKNLKVNKFASALFNLFNLHRIRSGRSNLIKYNYSFLKNVFIVIKGSNNYININKLTLISRSRFSIKGNNNTIIIGKDCSIHEIEICIEDDNNTITIGDNSTIGGETHLACIEGSKISIGQDCMFSKQITFRTGDSHSIIDLEGNRINPSMDIIVGNHVWIGNKVILLKGSGISENSVVATGAVVTRSFVKSNVIIAGTPARIVKEGITWLRERI